MTLQNHPYFPPSASINNYAPNETQLWILAGAFGGIIAAFLGVGLVIARSMRRAVKGVRMGCGDLFGVCWFLLCGFLHFFFEGYFVLNHTTLASSQSLFAQLWKEYALSDSRYLSQDIFVLSIESLTIFTLAPLSIIAVVCIARDCSLRHPVQAITSSMHLYSVAMYYIVCFMSESIHGVGYSRPEALYYWVYFIGFNAPWVVVPGVLLYQSSRAMKGAFDFGREIVVGKKRI